MNKRKQMLQEFEETGTAKVDLRIEALLRNAFVSKSGVTLADCDALKEIAKRLGYSKARLLKDFGK